MHAPFKDRLTHISSLFILFSKLTFYQGIYLFQYLFKKIKVMSFLISKKIDEILKHNIKQWVEI